MDETTEEIPAEEQTAPIKRSFVVNKDNELKYEQRPEVNKSKKKLVIIGLLVLLVVAGGIFGRKYHIWTKIRNFAQPAPIATPVPTPVPTPSPVALLQRPEWSFEVLNGSGTAGLAKKIADKIASLGYTVVKTGNADKDNYAQSQILIKSGMQEKIDLVIADLKDVIRIASIAGELTEGTASARIILGKDSI